MYDDSTVKRVNTHYDSVQQQFIVIQSSYLSVGILRVLTIVT